MRMPRLDRRFLMRRAKSASLSACSKRARLTLPRALSSADTADRLPTRPETAKSSSQTLRLPSLQALLGHRLKLRERASRSFSRRMRVGEST